MLLPDNERRAQKLTADESRPRLPVWVKPFYTQGRVGSNGDYPGIAPQIVWFRYGHF